LEAPKIARVPGKWRHAAPADNGDWRERIREGDEPKVSYLEHIVEAFEEPEEFEVFGENVVVDGEGWGGGVRKRASMKGMHAAREAGVISLMTKAEMDRVSPAFHLTFTMRSTVARASNPAGSHITVGQVKLQIVR
jgi:hypothetical protein